jgi:hypothetical protein
MNMLRAKDDEGNEVSKIFDWLESCDPCKAAGIGSRCIHIKSPPQPYQNIMGQKVVKAMLRTLNEKAYLREMLNIPDEPMNYPVFSQNAISQLISKNRRLDPVVQPRNIYVSVDPGGGVGSSYGAIMTGVFTSSMDTDVQYDLTVPTF